MSESFPDSVHFSIDLTRDVPKKLKLPHLVGARKIEFDAEDIHAGNAELWRLVGLLG